MKNIKHLKGLKLVDFLNEAHGCSTMNNNLFAKVINSIDWDEVFTADGETYYCKGNVTLTVENIDPFKEQWAPSALIDGCLYEFGLYPKIIH